MGVYFTKNKYIQLFITGIGDIIKRERPMIITKLSNIGAQKISVQSFHAGVVTLDGRAFLWGRNDYHQVTVESDVDQSSPKLFNVESNERVKDLSCGTYHTTILTYKNDLYYIGKKAEKVRKLNMFDVNTNNLNKKMQLTYDSYYGNAIFSTSNFILSSNAINGNQIIREHLLREQEHLEYMLIINSNLIKLLQRKNLADCVVYDALCRYYGELLHFTAAYVKSLIEYCNKSISECDILLFKYPDEYIFVYKNYLNTLYNILSVSGCQYIAKIIDLPACIYKLFDLNFQKRDRKNDEQIIQTILMKPFARLSFYHEFIISVISNTSNQQKFTEILNKWNRFIDEQEINIKLAGETNNFWTANAKTVEHLKTPERRIIKESHKFPLHLHNASLFSSHWFILLNDVFIHMNGSTSIVHDLKTIWVEPQQDNPSGQYQISLRMPEESIDLYTTQPEEKIQWFHALQNAIKNALGKSSAHQPPLLRSANYTFSKTGFCKDAKYVGRWLNGKLQGSGKMEWPDGKVYTGQFNNNQLHGFGRMDIPSVGKCDLHRALDKF